MRERERKKDILTSSKTKIGQRLSDIHSTTTKCKLINFMRFELSFQVSQDHVDKFVLNHVLVMQLMSTLLVMFCRGLWAQVCFKACIQPLLC